MHKVRLGGYTTTLQLFLTRQNLPPLFVSHDWITSEALEAKQETFSKNRENSGAIQAKGMPEKFWLGKRKWYYFAIQTHRIYLPYHIQ